jgi:protoporphyrinogen oxidase
VNLKVHGFLETIMKVAIIGAGFTGLAAAKKLAEAGVKVTVFERDPKPGGLAIGFKEPQWKWTIEAHYHHWFTGDKHVRELGEEIGHKIIYVRPKTSTLKDGEIVQLDSPLTLLTFNKLPLPERIRTGAVLAYLKFTPFWKPLETVTAKSFIRKYMGETSWKVIWEPLFTTKFGKYADKIPASWFWARIKTRSTSLGYPVGGYQSYVDSLESYLKKTKKIAINYNSEVFSIKKEKENIAIKTDRGVGYYDAVICTLPFALFAKICADLPGAYKKKLLSFESIGAVNLMFSLKKQFLTDGTYWLNVNDMMPFLIVAEHTNFMDKKYYAGEHLVYVGNYLDHSHKYFKYSEKELLNYFLPYLQKINPDFKKSWVKKAYLFKAYFAQPIVPLNYSKIMPPFKTPIDGVYLANLQQTNPFDRGTEYAVANGEKVAEMILKDKQ